MKKDFQRWHGKKSAIDEIAQRPFFHEREIWFCYVGVNVGFEQDGQGEDFLRPVVIIRKFNKEIFWGIPLTKSIKKLNKKTKQYYFDFVFEKNIESRAILSQLKLINARRLSYIIGEITKIDLVNLKEKLKALLP
ncbi:MAG: type II toxin-antitoxin system PemK/MazF family toxin [Patescibacteria group bacterium]